MQTHDHEEADTLMILHCCYVAKRTKNIAKNRYCITLRRNWSKSCRSFTRISSELQFLRYYVYLYLVCNFILICILSMSSDIFQLILLRTYLLTYQSRFVKILIFLPKKAGLSAILHISVKKYDVMLISIIIIIYYHYYYPLLL